MKTIIERIKEIIDNEKISVRIFEEKIGVSQGSINKSINAMADIKGSVMNKIVDVFPQYNPVWLLTGKGEMLINEGKDSEPLNYSNCPICAEKDRVINNQAERIQELKETISILQGGCSSKRHSA
jgi:hypothetical protein